MTPVYGEIPVGRKYRPILLRPDRANQEIDRRSLNSRLSANVGEFRTGGEGHDLGGLVAGEARFLRDRGQGRLPI